MSIEVSGKVQIALTISVDIEDIAKLGPLVTEVTQIVEEGGGNVETARLSTPSALSAPKKAAAATDCKRCGYGYWTKQHRDGCTSGLPVAGAPVEGNKRICPICQSGFASLAHRSCRSQVFT